MITSQRLNSMWKVAFLVLQVVPMAQAFSPAATVQSFSPAASIPSSAAAATTTTTTQLSMALAVPSPKTSLFRRRSWYDEMQPMGSRRTIYNDDIFDYDDDDSTFLRPFAGVTSAPMVLSSSRSSGAAPPSDRKRDKVRKAAVWAIQGLRRRN